ncbi:MAG: diguanylate cyclase [Planctomycetes bacterium]|nr:diguanylate cyclase [Planctomycetota bacterium]
MPPFTYWIAAAVLAAIIGAFVYYIKKSGKEAATTDKQGGPYKPPATQPGRKDVDPREAEIDRSAEVLREILIRLADTVRKVDGAANSSTCVLSDIRQQVGEIDPAGDIRDVQGMLVKEIDRVIQSNASLRRELASAHKDLAEQQSQIAELKTAVRVDALTQVGNRAAFDERLDEAIQRLDRYNEAFSLIMIDVDHFKKVNDTYGHVAGDRVLKGLAMKLKASLRGTDFLARYGGEEFGVILPKTPLADGKKVGEDLREAVEYSKFTLDNSELRISVSAGVAEAVKPESAESLVKKADKALYSAKEKGRNRVEMSEGL